MHCTVHYILYFIHTINFSIIYTKKYVADSRMNIGISLIYGNCFRIGIYLCINGYKFMHMHVFMHMHIFMHMHLFMLLYMKLV